MAPAHDPVILLNVICPSFIILRALNNSFLKYSCLRPSNANVDRAETTGKPPVNLPKSVSIPHKETKKRA